MQPERVAPVARHFVRSGDSALNPAAPIPRWICPSCERTTTTPFCPVCGERPLGERDLSLRGVGEKVLQALTSIDGRMIRTVRALVVQPGSLTLAYTQGRRRPFLGPVQLFLLANLVFFGAQSITHSNVFSSSLDSHLHVQDWSALAQQMVARHLAARDFSLAQLTPLFDRSAVFNAKWLVILMALAFSIALPLASPRSGRPFVAHVVFALHLYAFLLLLFSAGLAVAAASALTGGAGLASAAMDNALSIAMLAACALYLFFAIGRVYPGAVAARVVKAVLLAAYSAAVVLGYRFLIFVVTLEFNG